MTRWPGGLGRVAMVCALAACGRYGYDLTPDDDDPTAVGDGGLPDGPVVGTESDAAPLTCDEACEGGSCNAMGVCVITCDDTTPCPNTVECPSGFPCAVTCNDDDSCPGGIDCSAATRCVANCNGVRSCASGIECPTGDGDCFVNCTAAESCGEISCAASGTCEVGCMEQACTGAIQCGSGVCNLHCNATGACSGPINCGQSCACEVGCLEDGLSCQGGVTCGNTVCVLGAGCSTTGEDCDRCP